MPASPADVALNGRIVRSDPRALIALARSSSADMNLVNCVTLLQRRLDTDLISSLDPQGKGLNRVDFLVGMIVKLELMEECDLRPIVALFDKY